MKILVDEIPKEANGCLFAVKIKVTPMYGYVCLFGSVCWLEVEGKCPYLKECKHIEDDCK
jgi:hypothetical protein